MKLVILDRDGTINEDSDEYIKSPVDAFFDSVMVMAKEPELRQNRLALLADLRKEMNRVADISKLAQ